MTDAGASRIAETTRRLSLSLDEMTRLCTQLNLSARQREVLHGLLNEEDEATIAERIGVSRHTVHSHLRRLYAKLGVHGRYELVLHVFTQFVSAAHAAPVGGAPR
jgi:DNA-binding CsgD family transcriptional regulator